MAEGELASEVITLDSSGLFTLLNRRDPDHQRAKSALLGGGVPYLVPAEILAEIAYLLEQRMPAAVDPFLAVSRTAPSCWTVGTRTCHASGS